MVERFIGQFAQLIVTYPTQVRTECNKIDEHLYEIVVWTHKSDVGKLIGKDGKMINAVKTVISGCKAKQNLSYRISVRPNE